MIAIKGQQSEALRRSYERARSGRGRMGALRSEQIEVREEHKKGRLVRLIREERYNVPIPNPVKDEVRSLLVKCNVAFDIDNDEITGERVLGRTLVIGLHKGSRIGGGIRGLPVIGAEERKLRRIGFTHVTIHAVPFALRDEVVGEKPEGYDERGFGISFFRPKAGQRHEGEKGGELAHEIYDELSVLQWILENGLESLYSVKPLVVYGLLPKSDEQRIEENALAAKAQMAFGRPMVRPHDERSFHRARLIKRFTDLSLKGVEEWDEEGMEGARAKAAEAFKETVIGKKTISEIETGDFATQKFYLDESREFAYGIFNLPGARYIMAADYGNKRFVIQMMGENLDGLEQIEIVGEKLGADGFVEVPWAAFSAHVLGLGTVTPMVGVEFIFSE